MDELIKLGIKKDDIKAQNYSIYPDYHWSEITRENKVVGYRVSNILHVTIRDIDNCGKILDAVAKHDTNITSLCPINIKELSNNYYPMPIYQRGAGLTEDASSTPISAGMMEIRASVSIDFRY